MAQDLDTRTRLLEAARCCLLDEGFARLSTRRVAEEAGAPLSQIHYHFGGKPGLVLALLAHENARLLGRQREMYGTDAPLWKRYEQACDFLDEDLSSGYVRVLQEMVSAGWSDAAVATEVLSVLRKWIDLLEQVCTEAEERFGTLGPFTAAELAMVVGLAFLGGEQVILLGDRGWSQQVRGALRRVGDFIRVAEESA